MFVKKFIEKNKYIFSVIKFKYFNRKFRNTKPKNIYHSYGRNEINKIYDSKKNSKILFLQTQVGRGGAKWLIDIINSIGKVTAFGERNPKQESFFRYCKSHNVENYNEEFLDLIKSEILSDWETGDVSYISSPYFSHGIKYLYEKLQPKKLIILVPSFNRVMRSFKNKGWYKEKIKTDINQFLEKSEKLGSHFYGRIINLRVSNDKFKSLSQIGKIALFISTTLEKIYNEISTIDKNKILIFRIDDADQNYKYCKKFINKLGLELKVNEKKFLEFKKRTSAVHENLNIYLTNEEKIECEKYLTNYNYYEKKFLQEFDSKHYLK